MENSTFFQLTARTGNQAADLFAFVAVFQAFKPIRAYINLPMGTILFVAVLKLTYAISHPFYNNSATNKNAK